MLLSYLHSTRTDQLKLFEVQVTCACLSMKWNRSKIAEICGSLIERDQNKFSQSSGYKSHDSNYLQVVPLVVLRYNPSSKLSKEKTLYRNFNFHVYNRKCQPSQSNTVATHITHWWHSALGLSKHSHHGCQYWLTSDQVCHRGKKSKNKLFTRCLIANNCFVW